MPTENTRETANTAPSLWLRVQIKLHKFNTMLANLTLPQKALVVILIGATLFAINGLNPLTFIWTGVLALQLYFKEPLVDEFQYHDDIFALLSINNGDLIVLNDKLKITEISTVVIDQIDVLGNHTLLQKNFSVFKDKKQIGLLHFAFNKGGKLVYHFPAEQVESLTEFFKTNLPQTKIIK